MTTLADRFTVKPQIRAWSLCRALFLFAALAAAGCGGDAPGIATFNGAVMGTTYTVRAVVMPDADTRALARRVRDTLNAVDAKMSTYKADSELSRFNAAPANEPFQLSPDTADVFRVALEVSRQTDGAFDITVGPLVNAWGFGPGNPSEAPADAEVEALLALVGYRHLQVRDDDTVVKDIGGLYCDLSAVAKGYAVDRVAGALDAAGIAAYMVEVGGEVRTRGVKPGGALWTIGIEKPVIGERRLHGVLELRGGALASSGDYRNFHDAAGKRVSHTIDPRTGRPVEHGLTAVSVLHDACAYADAYATALMVLGPERGEAFCKRHNVAALLFLREGDRYTARPTPGFPELARR